MTDAMDADSSGDEGPTGGLTAAEEAVMARKKRLMEMKTRLHGVEMKEEDYEKEETETKRSRQDEKAFRSYQPINEELGKVESGKTNLRAVEEEIAEQLRLANDTSVVEQIDLQALAPKKVDWDLKRDIAQKLEKLERRTQTAIADIIRERLAEGQGDLASAVASAN